MVLAHSSVALLFTQRVSELLAGLTQDVNVASVEYWLMFQTARLYHCLCSGQSEPWLGPSTARDGCLSRPASPRALCTSAPALHYLEGPPAGTWWSGQDSEEGTWAWRRGGSQGQPKGRIPPTKAEWRQDMWGFPGNSNCCPVAGFLQNVTDSLQCYLHLTDEETDSRVRELKWQNQGGQCPDQSLTG